MRTKLFTAAAMSVAAIATLTTPAQAATASECRALIVELRKATDASSLAPKAEAGLINKAEAATIKLDAGKFADALGKLTDYHASLDALHDSAKPKISEADFLILETHVDAAIACVASITTT